VSARAVRLAVIAVCVAGVAGMIVTSVLNHNGAALTFGLITAVAILCLMVATAVTGGAGLADAADAERLASSVEESAGELIEAGADEMAVRDLIRHAVRLGRARAAGPATRAQAGTPAPP
jgi:hypothetical protein